MRHKRYIFLFILTVSVSLLVIGCVYNVISGKPWYANIMVQFFLNLPLCIGLGFIDFGVINLIYKRLKQRNNAVRILVDIVLTTALGVDHCTGCSVDVHLELPADGRAWKFLAYPEKLPAGSAVELDYRSADRDILL